MKAIINKLTALLALSALMALTTGCQKEDIGADLSGAADQVTITLAVEDAVATRAASAASTAPTRYIIEAFGDALYNTPIAITGVNNQMTVNATDGKAEINLTLDRTKDYYFLCWSDVSGETVYNTPTLKAVELKSGLNPVESWHGTAEILKGAAQTNLNVTLKRAVAKINLMENGKIPAGSSLVMTFDQATVFNTADCTVTTPVSRTETITNAGAIDGSITPVRLNSTEIYTFAAANVATVADIDFQMGTEEPFSIDNVPLQANRATNIKGHYTSLASETFEIEVDDAWTNEWYIMFSDPNFLAALTGFLNNVDTDHDGYISKTEAEAVTELRLHDSNISSLDGIEYFVNLEKLNCRVNSITALDLSKNMLLTELVCGDNKLTELDLSKNTALTHLDCNDNQLTELDLSKNTALIDLSCYSNQLTALDMSFNTELTHLTFSRNNINTINVSKNTKLLDLRCDGNSMTAIDVSKNTALELLRCVENSITELNLENNLALTSLVCFTNSITELDLSVNTALHTVSVSNNKLTTLDVSMLPDLEYLYPEGQIDADGNSQDITVTMTQTQIDANFLRDYDDVVVVAK